MANHVECPICGTPAEYRYGAWSCQTHGMLGLGTCVACEEEYPYSVVGGVEHHRHKCDPSEPREGGHKSVDGGKSFDDKLRDAELMGGAD